MQVMNVDRILDDVVAVIVGFAEAHPRFHAGACQPHCEAGPRIPKLTSGYLNRTLLRQNISDVPVRPTSAAEFT